MTAIEAIVNGAPMSYSLVDDAAALAAASAAVGQGATFVLVLTVATVAEMTAIEAIVNGAPMSYSLDDTSANLLAPAASGLVTGAFAVTVIDAVSVADANALLTLNGFTSYDLSDTAANLLADPLAVQTAFASR
jgi:alkylation response protein AidB-like acyl-CoA dehydrogenase